MKLSKKIVLGIMLLLGFLLSAGTGIIYFYGKELKTYLVKEIDKSIRIKVRVEDVDFTIFRYFPNAAITFKKVHALNTLEDDTLCEASRVSLLFNLKDVFYKNYTIKRVYIYDGLLKLKVDEAGNNSYTFWDKSDTSHKKFAIKLSQFRAEHLQLRYENKSVQRALYAMVDNIDLSGDLSDQEYALETAMKGKLYYYRINNTAVVSNRAFAAKLELAVKGQRFSITGGDISFAGLRFKASGDLESLPDANRINVQLSAKHQDLQVLSELLPEKYTRGHGASGYKGSLNMQLQLSGQVSATRLPLIRSEFSIVNGELTLDNSNHTNIREIAMNGSFVNRTATEGAVLELKQFSASVSDAVIKASLRVSDLDNPFIKGHIEGAMPLATLFALSEVEKDYEASGLIHIDAEVNDRLRVIRDQHVYTNVKAVIRLEDVHLKTHRHPIELSKVNGTFTASGADIVFKEISASLNESDLLLSGVVRNIIPWVFNDSIPMSIDGSVYAHDLTLEKLMALRASTGDTSGHHRRINIASTALKLNIVNVKFKKMELQGLTANVLITPRELQFSNVAFRTLQGVVAMDGRLVINSRDSLDLQGTASLKGLDVSELFRRLDNFGQAQLTSQNISGSITTNLSYKGRMDKHYQLNMNTLEVLAEVEVTGGELINFKPVMALSRYTRLKELQDVKFATLKNQVIISKGQIKIPEMEINSNSFNLKASGTHSFNNYLDYSLQLRLSELLGRKARSQTTEFGEIEEDEGHRTILPLHMYGEPSNIKISLDKAIVKQNFKKSVKNEWHTLKDVFKKEFNHDEENNSSTVKVKSNDPFEQEIEIKEQKQDEKQHVKEKQKEEKKTKQNSFQKLKDKLKGSETDE